MIEIMTASEGNLLAVKATDKLTAADYETIFIPRLEELLRQYPQVKVLFRFDPNFHGWELGAAWDDTKFGLKHRNDFEKIAMVGAPGWIAWGARMSSHFIACDIRTFADREFDDALAWINR